MAGIPLLVDGGVHLHDFTHYQHRCQCAGSTDWQLCHYADTDDDCYENITSCASVIEWVSREPVRKLPGSFHSTNQTVELRLIMVMSLFQYTKQFIYHQYIIVLDHSLN